MASNISVAITADVTDLQTKLALAQSNLRAFNSETKNLADQTRAAGDEGKASLLPALEAAATGAAAAKAEIASLNAELRETAHASGGFIRIRENLETLHASISQVAGAASALGELFLVGFGIERIGEFVSKSAELGEEMVRTAQKTGLSVESLSALKFAAETSGVSFDNLQTGLKRLSASIQEALITPSSKAALAFEQLGITSDFLRDNQNNLEVVLRKIADAYAAHADGAAKSANATAIMGRGGTELIPVLDQGADGLEKMTERAKDLGAVMSTETAERLEAVKQQTTALSAVWTEFAANIVSTIAPALTTLIEKLNAAFRAADWASLHSLQEEARKLSHEIDLLDAAITANNFGPMTKDAKAHLEDLKTRLAEVNKEIADLQNPPKAEAGPEKPELPGMEKSGKPETSTDISEEKELTKELDAELADRAKAQKDLQKEADADYAASINERYNNERELTKELDAEVKQRQKAQDASVKSWEQSLQPIKNAFDGMFSGVLQGTQTVQQAMQRMAQNIVLSYAEAGVKVAVDWAAHQLAMSLASEVHAAKALGEWVLAQLGISSASDTAATNDIAAATTAATTKHGIEAASNVSSVTGYAAVAAAAAAASVASIPYVGWAMAPEVAAETFSATMAWAPVASAAGGYDIPAGVNPLTQLHSQEMVLPANLANAVRGMAANGSAGRGGDTHFHGPLVQMSGSNLTTDDVASAVKKAVRDFHPALRGR